MTNSRRDFFRRALVGTGVLTGVRAWASEQAQSSLQNHMKMSRSTQQGHVSQKEPSGDAFLPVQTPDVPDLPFSWDNGVKVFHLVAEPVRRDIVPWVKPSICGATTEAARVQQSRSLKEIVSESS